MSPYSGSHREPVKSAFLEWGDPHLDPTTAGSLHFDLVIEETHERSCEITEHNVEEGGNITDHVRPNLDRLTLEVLVSNVPLDGFGGSTGGLTLDLPQPGQVNFTTSLNGGQPTLFAGGVDALVGKGLVAIGLADGFPKQINVTTLQFDGEYDFVADAYAKLTGLRNTATMVAVTTPKEFYPSMLLREIVLRRDASTGTSGTFTLELQQIRLVSSLVVAAPLPSIPRAVPEVTTGKKDAKKADGPKQGVFLKMSLDAGVPMFAPALGFPAPPPPVP